MGGWRGLSCGDLRSSRRRHRDHAGPEFRHCKRPVGRHALAWGCAVSAANCSSSRCHRPHPADHRRGPDWAASVERGLGGLGSLVAIKRARRCPPGVLLSESGEGAEEFLEQAAGANHAPVGEDQSDVIRQMQARIQQLEAEAAGRTSLLAAPAPAQELFPMQMAAGGLRQEDWDQLQKLAGPTPKRAPRPEAATAYRGEEFDTQAEVRLEAQEEEALAQLAQTGDPLHRILALQMQQTQALLARMGPRSSDPLSQALSGSSDSNQSSSGVKGCHAREIFIKHMEDLTMIARVTQRNVLQDMGYSQPFPGLMREFIEKRVPLGDMRTLTLLSHFMATGWEIGFNLNDPNIMGLMAKGLMMTEQFCFGWWQDDHGLVALRSGRAEFCCHRTEQTASRASSLLSPCEPKLGGRQHSFSQRHGLYGVEAQGWHQARQQKRVGQGHRQRQRQKAQAEAKRQREWQDQCQNRSSRGFGSDENLRGLKGSSPGSPRSKQRGDFAMMGKEVPFSADAKHSTSNHSSSSILHNPHSRSPTASYKRVTGPDSPGTFNFLDIINEVLQCNELASVGLAQFTRLSCKLDPRTAQQSASDRLDLWPLSSTCVEMDGTFSPVTSAPEAQEASGL